MKELLNKKNIIIGGIILFILIVLIILVSGSNSNKTVTIIFDTDGGTIIDKVVLKKGVTVPRPISPIKQDYEFVNWYDGDNIFNFDNGATKDITLKAKYISYDVNNIKYLVHFNGDGGTVITGGLIYEGNKVSVIKDGNVPKPFPPFKDGYRFIEWQLDNKKFDFNTPITKAIELKAKYEKEVKGKNTTTNSTNTYTVTFNTNGGEFIPAQYIKQGKLLIEPKKPVKEGFVFTGWKINNMNFDFNYPVNIDMSLTAMYKVKADYSFEKILVEGEYTHIKVKKNGEYIGSYQLEDKNNVNLCFDENNDQICIAKTDTLPIRLEEIIVKELFN